MAGKPMAVGQERQRRGVAGAAVSERARMGWPQFTMLLARVALGYLFFTQLLWKMPPSFGCPSDFRVTTVNPAGFTTDNPYAEPRSSGLCDWIGIESVWATQPRTLLKADISGQVKLGLPIGWLARINGALIDAVIKPNIRWMGWLIWGGEAAIFVMMFFGLLSRLGGLMAMAISFQLVIGLAGITNPYEWEWAYIAIFLLSVVLFGSAPGRFFGLDAVLRPRLQAAANQGQRWARLALALT